MGRSQRRQRPFAAAAAALLAVALLASGAAAATDPTPGTQIEPQPEPEWGIDGLRLTDPLADPEADVLVPDPEAYRLNDLSSMRSTAATTRSWALSGAGWGHGVGMSQYGAWEMAKDGRTAAQILAHYYPGTTYDLVPDTDIISVNIRSRVAAATMSTTALTSGGGPVTVTAGGTTMTGGLGASLRAAPASDGTGVTITCPACTPVTTLTAASPIISWDNDTTLVTVDGTSYKDGRLRISRAATGLNVVAEVRVHDEYLDYVTEVPWSWSIEALKAQAAAARGYALSALGRGLRSDCACHVFNTTVSQVFAGYPTAANLTHWPRWKEAVRADGSPTHGRVVRHNGRIIESFYASSTGGRTQNNEDVWGGTARPYLRSVDDPWSLRSSNPRRAWTATRTPAALASAFRLPDVARLDLSARTAGGAVATARATSSAGQSAAISGETLRSRLSLFSTYVARHEVRHGGPDRYATAVAVAERIPVTASSVVIASGEPDSLIDATVGGPLAGVLDAPILLTRASALPAPTLAELDRRRGSLRTAYVLGSEGTVSRAVADQLRSRGLTVVRLGGNNRYATAQLVAAEIARHTTVSSVVIAAGYAIADVVSSSGPSAALGQPILLTAPTVLSAEASASLDALRPREAYLVGNWVSGAAESAIRGRVSSVVRLSGPDRYATSAAIASHFAPRLPTYDRVVVSSGLDANLVDSIAAGPLEQPMLFVRPTAMPPAAVLAVQHLPGAASVVAIGNEAAVSAAVLRGLARS